MMISLFRGHTFKTSLSWGVERGSLILRCFGMGERGGVPLVYDVTNEKIYCNRKQAKEMKKKEKCENDTNK